MPYKSGMEDRPELLDSAAPTNAGMTRAWAVAGFAGFVALAVALTSIRSIQFQIVRYVCVLSDQPVYWLTILFGVFICLGLVVFGWWSADRDRSIGRGWLALSHLWPLLLAVPFAFYAISGGTPPFVLSLLTILGAGLAAFRLGINSRPWPVWSNAHQVALGSLVLLIVLLTVIHTRIQINFFEHFMLGHADFGHFTEELKNALAGRGLRSDSFDNTRFGWHFVPLLYALVPGYALFPSPVYLMVVGALVVHIVAIPVYFFARRISGSVAIGWMFGLAWLLLPSQSRMVYSNTYGFQWPMLMMPLLVMMIAAGVTGRWRLSLVMAILLLLCKETAAAATLGWGVYVALFTPRRKLGVAISVVSLVWFAFCVKWAIPHFAAAGRYERMDLFGSLASSVGGLAVAPFTDPGLFFGRLIRPQAWYFLAMLVVPMALLPLRAWRISLVALPTLLLILLMENTEWLSIKFWHQCTVLPILFCAGISTMKDECGVSEESDVPFSGTGRTKPWTPTAWLCGRKRPTRASLNRGGAVAILSCACVAHLFYGFSPLSKSYQVYAAASPLNKPDPRLAVVQKLRSEIPRSRTILATERLAAHFTDYRRLYTGKRRKHADFVIIDRADRWDQTYLAYSADAYASDLDYELYGEYGSIIVFARRAEDR